MATLSFKGASHLPRVTQEKEEWNCPVHSLHGESKSCSQKKKKRMKMRGHPVISARITSLAFSYQVIISHSIDCSLSPLDHELHEDKFFLFLYLLKTYCSNS